MLPEILVVDDDESAAKNYADLISARAKVAATFTSNASAAEQLMKELAFKVVVLDQRMPNVSGTALFERLKAINSSFKAIMLTGEADADEIGRAMQLGYSDYLHKGRVSELPGKVANELLKFHLDAAHKAPITNEVLVASDIGWSFLRRHETKVFVVSSVVLDEHFVRESE